MKDMLQVPGYTLLAPIYHPDVRVSVELESTSDIINLIIKQKNEKKKFISGVWYPSLFSVLYW